MKSPLMLLIPAVVLAAHRPAAGFESATPPEKPSQSSNAPDQPPPAVVADLGRALDAGDVTAYFRAIRQARQAGHQRPAALALLRPAEQLSETQQQMVAEGLAEIGPLDGMPGSLYASLLRSPSPVSRYVALKWLDDCSPEQRLALAGDVAAPLVGLWGPAHLSATASDLAAKLLTEMGGKSPAAVKPVAEALESPQAGTRAMAAQVLGNIGPAAKGAVPKLRRMAEDPEVPVRLRAAGAIARISGRPEEAIPACLAGLRDQEPVVRYFAADVLGSLGPAAKEAVPALMDRLKDEELGVRQQAGAALARIGPPAIESLKKALGHKDARLRAAALYALGEMHEKAKETIPLLVPMYGDPDADVRANVISTLGAMGPAAKAALPTVAKALEDPAEEVRRTAAMAIWLIDKRAKQAAPVLLQLVADAKHDVQNRADFIHTVAAMSADAPEVLPALVKLLDDPQAPIRQQAAVALGTIGPPAKAAVARLEQLAKDEDMDVRFAAGRAVARIEQSK